MSYVLIKAGYSIARPPVARKTAENQYSDQRLKTQTKLLQTNYTESCLLILQKKYYAV